MEQHLENRTKLLASIAGEIFGPGSRFDTSSGDLLSPGTEVDITKPQSFGDWESYNEKYQGIRPIVKGTGEEILQNESPLLRYGMGILFPKTENGTHDEADDAADVEDANVSAIEFSDDELKQKQKLEKKAEKYAEAGGSETAGEETSSSADTRLANLKSQRSMGVSFVVDAAAEGDLVLHATGGSYKRLRHITVAERPLRWWARTAINDVVSVSLKTLLQAEGQIEPIMVALKELAPIEVNFEIFVRGRDKIPGDQHPASARLITVSLVNRTHCLDEKLLGDFCLFQSRFTAKAGTDTASAILYYPEARSSNSNEETESLDLLYRNEKTFSTGHGCAGTWELNGLGDRALSVCAEPIPAYEVPSITPSLQCENPQDPGQFEDLIIPLSVLADNSRKDESVQLLERMITAYERWVQGKYVESDGLVSDFKCTAQRHLKRCAEVIQRMKDGLSMLVDEENHPDVSLAFRLTNKAMLLQALASKIKTRNPELDKAANRLTYKPPYEALNLESDEAIERAWRPFQIAFFLMNITALADPHAKEREIVDLIWFPTGGGKTEAYLACAAFSILQRRLRNPEDTGTEVLMRYTLRLLTAQQFQRASSLICALETLRPKYERLGTAPFTIGIWVGSSTTPNTIQDAKKSINDTKRNGPDDYKMVLLKCPWCGAAMGPNQKANYQYEVDGVKIAGQQISLHCPDHACSFRSKLPVEVVDENIYKSPPTYLIATVDKFAGLAWREECRSIFGIDDGGERVKSPPGLIIQDELHLITGPLGSMVGLYESLIDELSTDYRDTENPIKPKLVAATATTRASDRQIRDLYARTQTTVFPPPGIDASDSFFAKYAVDDAGKRLPGRMYVGVLPKNYSSALTTSVRLYASLLAAAWGLPTEKERDPWWTLLVFFNSLRELGGSLTLFGADIPERLRNIQNRWYPKGIDGKRRYLNEVLELTGRLASSEVPRALDALDRPYAFKPPKGKYPVDACLASNIIEVGVDVDRLAIMAVAGQPKTTAQYIQATGRVGRNTKKPGVILVNYGANKPRDLSHYEHFQAYHGKLYASVEPSSVTPYTIPVLDRALHAVMVAWVRQNLPMDDLSKPKPFLGTAKETMAKKCLPILKHRIESLTSDQKEKDRMLHDLNQCFDKRIKEWESSNSIIWHEYFPKHDSSDIPLIHPYGAPCPSEWHDENCWAAPNSMRGVDAECRPHIPSRPQNNQLD